ncbi:hypothetical protein OEM_20150 [Mycobacterium intracellulare subsp. yongonense 05-1390]|nr:hypothetical protein OEM_20150 [Mycobacterium intracellulare subsp. yongonense 05-1390]
MKRWWRWSTQRRVAALEERVAALEAGRPRIVQVGGYQAEHQRTGAGSGFRTC